MKKYFITSDIHSFFSEFKLALDKIGFEVDNTEHVLIICGDLFDRGTQAKELLNFLVSLQNKNRLILIRGNHEDLLEDCLGELEWKTFISQYHWTNGTLDTIAQLTETNKYDLVCGIYNFDSIWKKLEQYHELIWKAKNYYEIDNYIFVHGWIPHIRKYENLIKCSEEEWKKARWANGMQEWKNGWKLKNKTIVCGHWHTSFGNYHYHNKGSGEFEKDSDFNPFIDKGIIALDACTSYTKKVNILVI